MSILDMSSTKYEYRELEEEGSVSLRLTTLFSQPPNRDAVPPVT